MKSIGRNMRYLLVSTEQYFLATVGSSVLIVIIFSLGMNADDIKNGVIPSVPYFLAVYSMVMMVAMGMAHIAMISPVVLSFNTTRKGLWFGYQWMYFLLMVEFLVVLVLYCTVALHYSSEEYIRMLSLAVSGMLFAIGMGELLGGICLRAGKIGMVIMTVFAMLCGGVIGGIIGGIDAEYLFLDHVIKLVFGMPGHINMILLLAGAGSYVLGAGAGYLLIRRMGVKA